MSSVRCEELTVSINESQISRRSEISGTEFGPAVIRSIQHSINVYFACHVSTNRNARPIAMCVRDSEHLRFLKTTNPTNSDWIARRYFLNWLNWLMCCLLTVIIESRSDHWSVGKHALRSTLDWEEKIASVDTLCVTLHYRAFSSNPVRSSD